MTELLDRVRSTILSRCLLGAEQRVVVGVSGGGDSVVLLDLLQKLSAEFRWHLMVAHFNHRLRGKESDSDEAFVRRRAARYQLPFVSGQASVAEVARSKGVSVEMAARQLRHAFLARAARSHDCDAVALAQHADDQVETFLLKLLRGGGGDGLGGMRLESPSPADPQIRLVRPLLEVPREALLSYAKRERLRYREDSSNAVLDIPRNKVRHVLLPLLRRRFQAALVKTVPRTMEIIGAEAEFVAGSARRWLRSKRRAAFDALPLALQRRVLYEQLLDLGIAPGFELVERLRLQAGSLVMPAPGRHLWRTSAGLICTKAVGLGEFRCDSITVGLASGSGCVRFGKLEVSWKVRARRPSAGKPTPPAGCEWFDAEKVGGWLTLRHWRAGDRFQPLGMAGRSKLQDLFTNAKIPRTERLQMVLAADSRGELFWVQALRMGERCKLDAGTSAVLEWSPSLKSS